MAEDTWEQLAAHGTYRLKIDGGWLYRYGTAHALHPACMVFVPDGTSPTPPTTKAQKSPPDEWKGYCESE